MADIETPAPVEGAVEALAAEPAFEWDGADWSPETLEKVPGWKTLPEPVRGHITKAHEERTAAKERQEFLDRLFNADDDKLRKEHAEVLSERDSLKQERDSLKEALSGIEARAAEEAEEREYKRLEAKYADIWQDIHLDEKGELLQKGAYVKFVKLLQAGFDEEEAAAMARAVMITKAQPAKPAEAAAPEKPPEKPKVREVVAPPSIKQAGKAGNNPSATVNLKEASEDLNQRAARLIKEAEEEERRAARA